MKEARIEKTIENDALDTVTLAISEVTGAPKKSPEKQERIRYRRKQTAIRQLKPLLFIGPHLIFFFVFVIFPFVYGICISFFQWDIMGGGSAQFVGFDNFKQIFTFVGEDGFQNAYSALFWKGLGRTCLYVVVMVPLLICVPMAFAVMINAMKNKIMKRIFQAIMYASSLLSVATVVIIWQFMTDQDNGFFLNLFGSEFNVNYQPYAWIFIFVLTIWSGVGGNMVIFMAGLSNIPVTYYEAADIDGANALVKFWKITLPSMRFQLLYTTVTGTIGAFNVYGQPALFGGDQTEVLMVNIMWCLGPKGKAGGMASAMALLLGIIISAFSGLQFKMMDKGD